MTFSEEDVRRIAEGLTKMEIRAVRYAADAPLVGYAKPGAELMNKGLLEIRPSIVGWKPRRILTDLGKAVASHLQKDSSNG